MKVCSIFSQVLKLFSRGEFEKAVKEHKAERHARGFTSWGQFVAMLFCQVGRAHSLREICGGVGEGKTSEIKVARTLRFDPGTILAIDRGYNDFEWFLELTREGVFFVTRMKTNTVYTVVDECEVPASGNVLRDQIISLPALAKPGEEPVL